MTTDPVRGFTSLQYYLAHAHNMVHLLIGLPHALDQSAFRALVAQIIEAAPQLLSQESLLQGGHLPAPGTDLDDVIDHATVDDAAGQRAALTDQMATPLQDTGRAAFRAACRTAAQPDASGVQSWLAFQTTHALIEGGDIASILRGRDTARDRRPIVDSGLGTAGRLASSALVPILWVLHMLAAAGEKRDPADYAFRYQSLNRRDLTRAARRLGVSQRALVFGLVAHALAADPGRKRPVSLIYSMLPPERARISDDTYLNVRMDEVRVRLTGAVEADISRVASALDARGPSPIFVQTWQRKLEKWHRRIHAGLPWLYPARFHGFAPYDMILSMLPPVATERFSPLLAGARVFAGSNTGTAPSCIFVPTRDHLTLCVWADPATQCRFDRLSAATRALGIASDAPIGSAAADGDRVPSPLA